MLVSASGIEHHPVVRLSDCLDVRPEPPLLAAVGKHDINELLQVCWCAGVAVAQPVSHLQSQSAFALNQVTGMLLVAVTVYISHNHISAIPAAGMLCGWWATA